MKKKIEQIAWKQAAWNEDGQVLRLYGEEDGASSIRRRNEMVHGERIARPNRSARMSRGSRRR